MIKEMLASAFMEQQTFFSIYIIQGVIFQPMLEVILRKVQDKILLIIEIYSGISAVLQICHSAANSKSSVNLASGCQTLLFQSCSFF